MACPDNLFLRPLKPGDKTSGLSLGDAAFAPLKKFLRYDAKGLHEDHIAATYVLVEHPEDNEQHVYGYITLTASEIRTLETCLTGNEAADCYDALPGVKIARLAVHKDCRGHDYGTAMVNFAISQAIERIMPVIGCRFLIVDSKPSAVPFYERCGFNVLDTEDNRKREHPVLFIDLHKLAGAA